MKLKVDQQADAHLLESLLQVTDMLLKVLPYSTLRMLSAVACHRARATDLSRHLGYRRLLRPRVRSLVSGPDEGLSARRLSSGGVRGRCGGGCRRPRACAAPVCRGPCAGFGGAHGERGGARVGRIVSPKYADDAVHIALATAAEVDLLVSWNFRHIVHYEKIRLFNAVNLERGYKPLQIYSPREVAHYGEDRDPGR